MEKRRNSNRRRRLSHGRHYPRLYTSPCRPQGRDEGLFWDLADQLDPKDGVLWIHNVDDDSAVMGFTDFGPDNMRELIADQIDRRDQL